MGLALRKVSSRTVTLRRGTVVAHIAAANKVLSKLTPRIVTKAFCVNTNFSVHLSVEVEIGRKLMNPDVS